MDEEHKFKIIVYRNKTKRKRYEIEVLGNDELLEYSLDALQNDNYIKVIMMN